MNLKNLSVDNFFDIFKEHSEKTAFISTDKKISFETFATDVRKYAFAFNKISDEKIILFIKDDIYLFSVYFFALALCGKTIILPSDLSLCNKDTYLLTADTSIDLSNEELLDFNQSQNCKIVFFTSGSTSKPKEIIKTIPNVLSETIHLSNKFFNLTNNKHILIASILPYHAYGFFFRLFIPIILGLPIEMQTIFTPEQLQEKLSIYNTVIFATTPSFMDALVRYQDQYCFRNSPVGIFSSGALLSNKTSSSIFKIFNTSPIELYGSTETGSIAYRQQINGETWQCYEPVSISTTSTSCIFVKSPFMKSESYSLSDKIEQISSTTFLLKERTDRMVKIFEKRISLPEMEDIFNQHPFIEKSYILSIAENKLGATLVLTPEGKNFLKTSTKKNLVFELEKTLAKRYPHSCFPKKYRFVYDFPTNPQGKLVLSNLKNLFNSNIAEPVVENLHITENEISMTLTFISDSIYFQGHFPDFKLLPGVVQIYFASYFIKNLWHIDTLDNDISKFKCMHMIFPNKTIQLKLTKKENKITFSFENENEQYSCGTFVGK